MQKKWLLGLGLLLSAVLAAGCSEPPSTAPTTADLAKERDALIAKRNEKAGPNANKKGAPAKPGATPAAGEGNGTAYASGGRDYFYDPTGKRDPFRSFRFDEGEPEQKQTFGPLADFEIGQLELSAVVWDHRNPRALVIDPGGRTYIVREGSQIGKNNGEVVRIEDNLVLVKETYVNFAGERTTKDVELRIRLSQGG